MSNANVRVLSSMSASKLPPPSYTACVRVGIPLEEEEEDGEPQDISLWIQPDRFRTGFAFSTGRQWKQ